MEFTENLNLPCLSGEDYGALALYMQHLAERVEAEVLQRQAAAESFNDQPTAIITNNQLMGPIAAGFMDNLSVSQTIFKNFTGGINNLTVTPGFFTTSGLYHLGYMVNSVEVGAVTVASSRAFELHIRKRTGGSFFTETVISKRIQAEGSAGGSFFGSEGTFIIDNEPHLYECYMVFAHDNAASQVQIPINGLRIWLTKIGDTSVIEVT